jgi:ATP-binding cassette, subfamily B, bacterial
LRPGETLGIVGRTGSGKSTLLRLIMRFYDVDTGRILIDGKDVRDLDLEDLRSSVGLVSQEVYLFQGTVRDNVLYGHPGASDQEVIRALREAGGEELLETLAGGLDADVGERGRKLSGGERQRVAIARVLLKRAPILALDEVTSHLDYETEAAVQRSVRKVNRDRSLITVAHRLSTIRDSSKILVLDKGKIHEAGKHEELIAKGGIYWSLWGLQTGEKRA